jgi:hypothetical protein
MQLKYKLIDDRAWTGPQQPFAVSALHAVFAVRPACIADADQPVEKMLRSFGVCLACGGDFVGRLVALAELLEYAQSRGRHDRASVAESYLSIDQR